MDGDISISNKSPSKLQIIKSQAVECVHVAAAKLILRKCQTQIEINYNTKGHICNIIYAALSTIITLNV